MDLIIMGRSGKKQRSATERAYHLAEIARRTLQGETQHMIADDLGVSQPTVAGDLKRIRKQWAEPALDDWITHLAKELARLDLLEATYWAAWERSKQPVTKKYQRERVNPVTGELEPAEIVHETVDQVGDDRWLQGVERCIDQRCRLLRLIGPETSHIFNILVQQRSAPPNIAPEIIIDDPHIKAALQAFRDSFET